MKRLFAALTLISLVLCAPLSFSSCAGRAPDIEEIYNRVIELIDASHEINRIFFGEGLPTYPRDEDLPDPEMSYIEKDGVNYLFFTDPELGRLCRYYDEGTGAFAYARVIPTSELTGAEGESVLVFEDEGLSLFAVEYSEGEIGYEYDDAIDNKSYDVVRFDSPYLSIEQLKAAAAEVYSSAYLNVVFGVAFDGVASFSAGGSGVVPARFIEQGGLLRQQRSLESMLSVERTYDYSTMKIVKPSNGRIVNITIESSPAVMDTNEVRLTLVLQGGEWYLDTPTY